MHTICFGAFWSPFLSCEVFCCCLQWFRLRQMWKCTVGKIDWKWYSLSEQNPPNLGLDAGYGLDLKCTPKDSCVCSVTGSRSTVLCMGLVRAELLLGSWPWLEAGYGDIMEGYICVSSSFFLSLPPCHLTGNSFPLPYLSPMLFLPSHPLSMDWPMTLWAKVSIFSFKLQVSRKWLAH